MPHKHRVKVYVQDGYYHVYNRGVEKRDIFIDDQDYRVFLHLLKHYLSPASGDQKHPLSSFSNIQLIRPRPLQNLAAEVTLLAYCLMPNHFHLLIQQHTKVGMTKLLQQLSTTYALYFNRRYKRVGYLFQGNYKAALITKDPYLLHVSRYIHLNPSKLTRSVLVSYPYSSYPYYLGQKSATWINPEFIISYFKNIHNSQELPDLNAFSSYKDFVESYSKDPLETIGNLAID